MSARWLVACALALTLGSAPGCAQLGLYQPGTADAPEVLEVSLRDDSILVRPRLVARGKVTLDIANDGTLEHGFRLVGPGVDEQSQEFLGPGDHRRVSFKLEPGTYRLFCPDGNHAALGMWAQLVVGASSSWFRR
jgi:hypothetical protein